MVSSSFQCILRISLGRESHEQGALRWFQVKGIVFCDSRVIKAVLRSLVNEKVVLFYVYFIFTKNSIKRKCRQASPLWFFSTFLFPPGKECRVLPLLRSCSCRMPQCQAHAVLQCKWFYESSQKVNIATKSPPVLLLVYIFPFISM